MIVLRVQGCAVGPDGIGGGAARWPQLVLACHLGVHMLTLVSWCPYAHACIMVSLCLRFPLGLRLAILRVEGPWWCPQPPRHRWRWRVQAISASRSLPGVRDAHVPDGLEMCPRRRRHRCGTGSWPSLLTLL